MTDPAVEAALLDRDPGVFPVPGRVFVTVSLSEPFGGHIYKLAAAVVRAAHGQGERK